MRSSPPSCAPTATTTMWVAPKPAHRVERKAYCEAADLAGDRMYPLSAADCGYAEGGDRLGRRAAVHGLAHARPYARRRGAAVRRVSLLRRYPVCGQHRPYRSGGRQQCTMTERVCVNWQKLPIPRGTQVPPGHGEFSTFGDELTTITSSAAVRGETTDLF